MDGINLRGDEMHEELMLMLMQFIEAKCAIAAHKQTPPKYMYEQADDLRGLILETAAALDAREEE